MERVCSFVLPALGMLVFAANGFAAATPRTCPTGITKDMVINYNDDVSCSLDVIGEIDFYRFQGTSGEVIHITMAAQANRGPCFRLYDPTGADIQEVCNASLSLPPIATAAFTLARTGTYTVRAYDYGSDGTFAYRIYLERSTPPLGALPTSYGQNPSGRIEPGEEVDQWLFAGGAGDQIAIQVTAAANRGPCFALYQPDGTIVQTEFCNASYSLPPLVRSEFNLPVSGTYMIRVYDYFLDTSWDYNLFVQCLGTCTAGTLGLPTVTVSLTGCTECRTGDIFSAKLTASNPPGKVTELKLGFYLPDASTATIGYPHLELPPQFTFDGEVLRGPIVAAHQRGNWRFCGRVNDLAVGEILAASCQTFTILP